MKYCFNVNANVIALVDVDRNDERDASITFVENSYSGGCGQVYEAVASINVSRDEFMSIVRQNFDMMMSDNTQSKYLFYSWSNGAEVKIRFLEVR